MLVFSTRFPLKDEVTMEDCVNVFTEWVVGSPHYGITQIECSNLDSDFEIDKGNVRFFIKRYVSEQLSLIACRLENHDDAAMYRLDCIVLDEGGDKSVLIQLNRHRAQFDAKLPRIKRPYIVRKFIDKGYCKDDAGIPVTDVPLKAESYYNICVNIMKGKCGNSMPVVYVSSDFLSKPVVNVEYLAQRLGGIAHVFVETTRNITLRLRDATDGNNAHSGYVGIYYPETKTCRRYSIHDFRNPKEMVWAIIDAIWTAQINRLDSSIYNWNQIIALQARQKMLEWKDTSGNIQEELELYTKLSDDERESLRKQIKLLNEQLYSVQAQLDTYRERFSDREEKQCFYHPGDEPALYPSERSDLLYSILSQVKHRFPEKSRGYCLIQSMLDANPSSGACRKVISGVRSVFKDGERLNKSKKSKLRELGFEIEEDINNHYKIIFHDPRYMFTTASTPGEYRGGKNLVSEICKLLDVERKI